jgi:hypothetical protein
LVIVPILGWVAVGLLLHHTREWPAPVADEGTIVVVPPRPGSSPDIAGMPRPLLSDNMPASSDRAGLARALQKELARVGCYDGEITGIWAASSRQAMRRFTDQVNAKLPLGEPDQILLRLVRSHRSKVCDLACSSKQQPDGACAPSAAAAQSPKVSADSGPAEARTATIDSAAPLFTGSTTAAAATAVSAMPRAERGPPPPPAQATIQRQSGDDDPTQRALKNSPEASAGSYEPRRRQSHRRMRSRPPAVVRSFVRNVQRALDSLGVP